MQMPNESNGCVRFSEITSVSLVVTMLAVCLVMEVLLYRTVCQIDCYQLFASGNSHQVSLVLGAM